MCARHLLRSSSLAGSFSDYMYHKLKSKSSANFDRSFPFSRSLYFYLLGHVLVLTIYESRWLVKWSNKKAELWIIFQCGAGIGMWKVVCIGTGLDQWVIPRYRVRLYELARRARGGTSRNHYYAHTFWACGAWLSGQIIKREALAIDLTSKASKPSLR